MFLEKKILQTLEWSLKRTSNTLVKRPWSTEQMQHNPRSQQSLGSSPLQVQAEVFLYPLTTGSYTGLHRATPGRGQLYWLRTWKQSFLTAYTLGTAKAEAQQLHNSHRLRSSQSNHSTADLKHVVLYIQVSIASMRLEQLLTLQFGQLNPWF